MPLTIVAHITAIQGKADHVRAALEALVTPTRAEAGCLQYDLHQDNDDPNLFLFFENWETRDLWQDHMQADHIKAFGQATAGAVASVAVYEMSKIA